jgi:prevent-host-death family protein
LAITTLTSREFNQDTARAKRAAAKGPVFITDRGRTSHVLLSLKEYESLANKQKNILELLAMPGLDEIDADFEFPRMNLELRIPEFDVDVYADAESPDQVLESSQKAPATR